MNFLKNRTFINSRDKLLPVYNRASSGLKKTLVLIILYMHKSVSVNVCPVILFWTPYFLIILMAVFMSCYCIGKRYA